MACHPIGGVGMDVVTTALDRLFAEPLIGRPALARFLHDRGHCQNDGSLSFWSIASCRPTLGPALPHG